MPATQPRILFIACHLPFPPVSGGRRRELELIRRICRNFEVHLMVVSKTFEEDRANAHELKRHGVSVEVFPADDPPPADGPRDADPPMVQRHRSPPMSARVAQVLERGQVDAVHVEGFYLMEHVPERTHVPVMLVEQNIEYDLDRQRAASRGRARDMRTHRAEVAAWRRAHMLGALTTEDRDLMLATLPGADVRLVPDGADHLPARSRGAAIDRPDEPLMLFLANFGYEPNLDATAHLLADILPQVLERVPDVHLWLVGTDPPAEVREAASARVRVTGRVPDVGPYLDAADVVVCPLRVGGGMKVKAIEAVRRGRCVVSTAVGVQGMPAEVRSAIAVADDPQEFADAVSRRLLDPSLRAEAESRSARAARRLPTWDAAADALARAYHDLLGEAAQLRTA